MVAAFAVSAAPAHAEKRVALVVGNNDDWNVPKLQKAVNDARTMGDTLKQLGFTVMVAENQNRQAFSQTLLAFDNAVDAGDTAFFFFAGHGFEIAGQNFLLPRADNLPRERDAFVGRAADLAALAARLDAGVRLLTILGPGGTGKTRLVRRYGCDLARRLAGRGLLLRPLRGTHARRHFLRARRRARRPARQGRSGDQLGHALAAAAAASHPRQLRADRRPRRCERRPLARPGPRGGVPRHEPGTAPPRGEEVLPLEPLAVEGDGVELFALRARAHRPDFALTPANRALVGRIVELLDGLPLAIELAAARIRVMSPAQLVERLADRFPLLAGTRGAAERQATLRNAIDWSWNLLVPWEQAALAQASVFEGGFTLEAAEEVLDLARGPMRHRSWTPSRSLVDKSLLRTWVPVEQARHDFEEPYFGMFLSIHEYAAEKLARSGAGRRQAAEERHGRHFARSGSDDDLRSLYRHGGGARRRALMLELDNLVVACRRAVAREDAETAVAALRATWEALQTKGPFELAIGLGNEVDALQSAPPSLRAAALTALGRANTAAGRLEPATRLFERALALARSAGDPAREAEVLTRLANAERLQGRMNEARSSAERALALRAELGEADGVALAELGIVQRQTGAMDDARTTYERALAIDRELGDVDAEAKALNSLAIVYAEQGRFDDARTRFESALALSRELGDRRQTGLVLGNLGSMDLEQGRHASGREHCEAALAIHRDTGERVEEGNALGNLGTLDMYDDRLEEARSKFVAALALAGETGNRRQEGVLLGHLAGLEQDQGHFDEARSYFDRALAIHRAVGNRRYEGTALARIGDLLLQQDRREEARASLAQAEALLRAIDEKFDLAQLLCVRGRLDLADGAPAQARASLDEASAIGQSLRLEPQSELARAIVALRAAIEGEGPTAR